MSGAMPWPEMPMGAGERTAAVAEDEVRVHLVDVAPGAAAVARLGAWLSEDEQARARRFHFRADADRFVVSRAALRAILAAELGIAPGEVAFAYGAHGKPELAPPLDASGLRFSASHSGRFALHAVARGRPVGVDIERLRPVADLEAIAARTFSPRERAALGGLSGEAWQRGFFAAWTRKEAYVKALGTGLSHPLERFTVSLVPGLPARLEHVEDDPGGPERFALEAIDPDPAYAAALAVAGRLGRLLRVAWRETAR